MVDFHQLLTSLGSETDSTEMDLDTVRLGILGTEVPVVLADQVALEVLVFLEVLRLLCLAVLVVQVDRDDLVDRKVPAVQAVLADRSLLVVLLALDNRLVLEVLVGQVVHSLRACLVDLKVPEVLEDRAVTVDLMMAALLKLTLKR